MLNRQVRQFLTKLQTNPLRRATVHAEVPLPYFNASGVFVSSLASVAAPSRLS